MRRGILGCPDQGIVLQEVASVFQEIQKYFVGFLKINFKINFKWLITKVTSVLAMPVGKH